jgi:hypothetical protein
VDKADRSAATVRKASRIGCRMASCCAKSQRFLLARDIGEGQASDQRQLVQALQRNCEFATDRRSGFGERHVKQRL